MSLFVIIAENIYSSAFKVNKLAQFLSKSPKKNSYYSQETTPKDPIEKIIKDSKHDNLSAANSLVDLLSLDGNKEHYFSLLNDHQSSNPN